MKKKLFIVLGCACLDWRGLDVLANHGYLLHTPEKAGGNSYTLWGDEKIKGTLKEKYWGSHNEEYGSYILTSFGDHEEKRESFPDIFWHIRGVRNESYFKRFETELFAAINEHMKPWGAKIAETVVFPNSNHDIIIKELLNKLFYFKNSKINIPVFMHKDREIIDEIKKMVDEIMLNWAETHYDNLKNELKSITPNKQGVDYKDTFTQIWHYVFGNANKHLARMNVIFNPYSSESDFRGYLPCVHENSLGL